MSAFAIDPPLAVRIHALRETVQGEILRLSFIEMELDEIERAVDAQRECDDPRQLSMEMAA